jgi:hypothetical protein
MSDLLSSMHSRVGGEGGRRTGHVAINKTHLNKTFMVGLFGLYQISVTSINREFI